MLPTKFQLIWESSFRGEDFLEINQSETIVPVAVMCVNGLELNEQSLSRTFQGCFKLRFYFLEINQLETRIVCGGDVCQQIGTKYAIFIEDLQ